MAFEGKDFSIRPYSLQISVVLQLPALGIANCRDLDPADSGVARRLPGEVKPTFFAAHHRYLRLDLRKHQRRDLRAWPRSELSFDVFTLVFTL